MKPPVQVFSLYSGSEGNSFLIKGPQGSLLIDAGKSAKRLTMALRECGSDPSEIGAILVTHEHSDHISALAVLLKKHPIPVHAARACAERLSCDSILPHLVSHPPLWEGDVCGMHIRSFPTPHDSRASVGYRLEIPTDGGIFSLGYATDLGTVTPEVEEALLGCHAVILESNHDPEMLRDGPYPPDLKRRIAGRYGHLSNPDSAALAARLTSAGTQALMLAHLSRENNLPELARGECLGAVASAAVAISIAAPDSITEFRMEQEENPCFPSL